MGLERVVHLNGKLGQGVPGSRLAASAVQQWRYVHFGIRLTGFRSGQLLLGDCRGRRGRHGAGRLLGPANGRLLNAGRCESWSIKDF